MSSDESDIEERFANLELDKSKDKYINILLLGETGVGKSTFINALGNYFVLKYFDRAEDNGVEVAIPAVYEITDRNNKTRKIRLGKKLEDDNESLVEGESATQGVRTYVFRLWRGRVSVRLIDTPGIGDTRGIERDEENCQNILNYVKHLEKIHAICFLFKPTQARETIFFKYCLHQLLCRFDKSACKNIFFLFTNTRGSDYSPGETNRVLEKIVKAIQEESKDIKISVDKNVYCFDNEAFKYLAAVERKIKFDDSIREVYFNSWKVSAKNAHSLVTQLQRGSPPPYSPDNLITIHSARKMLFFCAELLADMSQIMEDNLKVLNRLQARRSDDMKEIENLKKSKTHITDVEKTKVCQPITVCTGKECAEVFWVKDEPKWHYKKVCHGTCIEVLNVRKEIVGCPELLNCRAISQSTRKCLQCGCDYSIHMHIDFITRIKESYILDDKTLNIIAGKENILDNSREIIDDISLKNVELQSEYEAIQTFAGSCASYLHKNAIVSFSSSFKDYVIYLINQKRSLRNLLLANKSSSEELENLQKKYEQIEKIFEEALKNPKQATDIQYIEGELKKLSALKHNSEKIRKFLAFGQSSHERSIPAKDYYVQEKYYEEDEDVKKGAKNKPRHDQRRDGKRDKDDRDKKHSDRRNVNEDRNKKEWDSRNRNDHQYNRDRNDHQQTGRPTESHSSSQNYPPQGAYGGYHYPPNDQRPPPPRNQDPSQETYKVTLNIPHPDKQPPHPPPYYPPADPHQYPSAVPPPYPGQPPYYPPQGQTPHYPHPDRFPHYPPQDRAPYYPPQDRAPYYSPRGNYPQQTPYQRPPPPGQRGRGDFGSRNQQPRKDQRGEQSRRGGFVRRGNDNMKERGGHRVAKHRYRRNDSRKKENDSGDESDESVASSKRY